MPHSKDQQTSHALGGWIPPTEITRLIAAGYTSAQLARHFATTPQELARVLALATPT